MKYLGAVKREVNQLTMPDAFQEVAGGTSYEAVQVGDTILLMASPVDRERLRQIEELANRSIGEHRRALEGLAR